MIEEWVRKLVEGETLQGEDALRALKQRGWRLAVQVALVHLERGDVKLARVTLEQLLRDEAS